MPKNRHFTNPDLRALDQELAELKARVEDLETLVKGRMVVDGSTYTFYPLDDTKPPIVVETGVTDATAPTYSEPQVRIDPRDQAADTATQEVADELQPDRYYVHPEGRGWYTVRSGADGEPVHEGKLRKPQAGKKVADLLEARRAANG